MQDIFQFLQKFEVWIYAVLGGIGLWVLRKVVISYQEWRMAVFGLEKESAQRRFSAALTVLVFIGLFIVTELVLVSFVAPTVVGLNALTTPTLNLLATPTLSLEQIAPAATATATPAIEPTLSISQQACLPGQIEWLAPVAGQAISGTIDLEGIVNVTNLGFYKYEYSQTGSDIWNTIAGGTTLTSAESSRLGEWNTSLLVPGDYLLRLVVLDNQNNAFPVCIINVRVTAP